jgi:hypothetical protein
MTIKCEPTGTLLGEALQPPNSAKTVRLKNGKVTVTDGPYAETKEQIGELVLEVRDLDRAVHLVLAKVRPLGDSTRSGSERDGRREQAPAGKGRLTRSMGTRFCHNLTPKSPESG